MPSSLSDAQKRLFLKNKFYLNNMAIEIKCDIFDTDERKRSFPPLEIQLLGPDRPWFRSRI
jgi:hypothetical protein